MHKLYFFAVQAFVCLSLLLVKHIEAKGTDIELGPFRLQIDMSILKDTPRFKLVYTPLCDAILKKKQLEMTVMVEEKENDKIKIVTKNLLVEPYLFGFDLSYQPFFLGKMVEEKFVKEQFIQAGEKLAEPNFIVAGKLSWWKNNSSSSETTPISAILDIQVKQDSSFDPPKNLNKLFERKDIKIVCHI